MKDPIRIVEAAYSLDAPTEEEWLTRVAEAALQNVPAARGAVAYAYEVQQRGSVPWIAPRSITEVNFQRGLGATLLDQGMQEPHVQRATVAFHRASGLHSALRFMQSTMQSGGQETFFREAVRSLGFDDIVTLMSADPTSLGCVVALATHGSATARGSTALQWQRVAAHISAGFRLRRKIGAGRIDATQGAEAILESNGDVAHATDEATPRSTRDALRAAAVAAERARGPLRHRAPDEAIETWRGLIAGRWTLVDHFEGDGRRYYVVHRNDPEAPDPRALTLRERQIVGYVALGQSNKLIAYELGLSPSTVAVHLQRASAKLGAQSRAALAAFVTPGSLAGR